MAPQRIEARPGEQPAGPRPRRLRTIDLARAVGIHANTVRLYEAWGYLPPVGRSRTGYRQFTERHLDHLRLARLLRGPVWPGHAIHRSAVALILRAARDGLDGLDDAVRDHLALVRAEQVIAQRAQEIVRHWLDRRDTTESDGPRLRSGAVVRSAGVSYDRLRNWERNGLLQVERDAVTGERRYVPRDLDRITVIRALRTAGYSPMAILRMLTAADAGDPVAALGTLTDPEQDPDLSSASDRWAATLADHERRALEAVDLIRQMRDGARSTLH